MWNKTPMEGAGMADDDKGKDAGAKPGDGDADKLKSALEQERARAKKAENDLAALRVEMAKLRRDDDASKSDMQKLTERLQAAEEKQAAADARALRAEVAAEKKLTAAQAKRLQGSTREELETDADELLAAFKPAEDGKDAGGKDAGDGKGKDAGPAGDGGQGSTVRTKDTLRPGASPENAGGKSGDELAKEVMERVSGGV